MSTYQKQDKGKKIEDLSDRELQIHISKQLTEMIRNMAEFSSILYDIMSEDLPDDVTMPKANQLKALQKKIEEEHVPGYN